MLWVGKCHIKYDIPKYIFFIQALHSIHSNNTAMHGFTPILSSKFSTARQIKLLPFFIFINSAKNMLS
jgi:hypothetical protein